MADCHRPGHDQAPAGVENGQGTEAAQQSQEGEEETLHLREAQVATEVILAEAAETIDLRLFLAVRPHDSNAGQIFVRLTGQCAELRLNGLGAVVYALSQDDHGNRETQHRK